jgi:hypothetical protein
MFGCMNASLKMYAILASVSRTQLVTSSVGNILSLTLKFHKHTVQIHPPLNILTLSNWLAV